MGSLWPSSEPSLRRSLPLWSHYSFPRMGSRVGTVSPSMGSPLQVSPLCPADAENGPCSQERTLAQLGAPVSPAAGMHQPSLPGAGRVIFWGQGGCKGHCCPLLVQGQGERGQPGSHPGGSSRAGRDTAVPCCHLCAECVRARPGCHRLGKPVCGCSIPLAGKEPFWSQIPAISHLRIFLTDTAAS